MNPPQRFAMIEGWNSKHLWKRVCMQTARKARFAVGTLELEDCAELQRCNSQGVCTFLLPLALRRVHAATPMY